MNETLKATVRIRKVKSGTQALILVPSRAGQREQVLGTGNASRDLAAVLAREPAQLDGLEVEYVLEKGQVEKVRRAGSAWEPATEPGKKAQGPKFSAKGGIPAGSSSHSAQKGHPGRKENPQAREQASVSKAGGGPAFENPYNFVPAPPRPSTATDLGDHAPLGHHRYHSDHWSGRIGVKLTTVTPLLIPDAAKATDHDGHKVLGLRLGPDGAPYLPPTSVKGMLRSAYEAITDSRFGIFGGHGDPLAIRHAAQSGAEVVPARVLDDGETLELLPGTTEIGPRGGPVGRPSLMYAAWIPMYGAVRGLLTRNRHLAQHGQPVWAEIERWEHWVSKKGSTQWAPNFDFWRVVALEPNGPNSPTVYSQPSPTRPRPHADATRFQPHSEPKPGSNRWVHGWASASRQNIDRKHDERVFFVDPRHVQRTQLPIPITEEMRRKWQVLIANYQDEHKKEISQGAVRPPALRDCCVWSRHIVAGDSERNLRAGTLCYAKLEQRAGGGFDVLALYPVMISRDLYELAPADLVPPELLPPLELNRLSPADRVFGWVHGKGHGAFRGQLRVGPVTCEGGAAAIEYLDVSDPQGLALAILGQPKPQQARFYVARDKEGKPLANTTAKRDGYNNGAQQGLRGRKFYPHQRQGKLRDYWSLERVARDRLPERLEDRHVYQEFRRLPDPDNQDRTRDKQNRSILAWVKPETTFCFELQITNLSALELGALLWLLKLPAEHYLRLGLGKPLGFGSVRLEIDADALDLRDGGALAQDYRRLMERGTEGQRLGNPADERFGKVVEIYTKAVMATYQAADFVNVSFVRAFLHACRGGKLPVHYPRTSPEASSSSKIYEWFVANEDGGRGPRQALPSLEEEDRGLPCHP